MSKLWRKIMIWGVVIVSLIVTCFLPYLTFAAGVSTDTITLPSTAGQLKEAAEIQLVVNTFKKCVEAAPAGGTYEYEGKNVYGVAKEKNDIFPDIFVNNTHTDIAAGAWLEYKVQDKVNNGTIYCDDSDSRILNLFASKLGISTTAVACNINAGNGFEVGQRGGLLKRVVLRYKPGSNQPYYDVSNSCAPGLSDSSSYYVWANDGWNYDTDSSGTAEYLGGVDYVRFLYDRFKSSSDNPYLVEWDDLGNFTNPAMGYYLYLNDFYTSCGSSTVEPGTTNSSDMWGTPISLIDENYGVSEKYFRKNVVKEDWDSSFVNRSTPHTCTAVINRINELVDGARGELISRKQEACNSASFDIADKNWLEAQAILNNEEMDEESKAKAQEVIDQINSYDGEFWTYTESGGVVCQPIPSVTGATTIVDEDPAVTPEPGPGEDPGVLDGCSANAGAIGWIVCPVLRILGEATDAMFITVANQYLTVDPEVINNPGMNEAWGTFQTFANIIFVIFLLVVILSQVTGFGISNYGVKKILPRLIITAVLVNLSFILCAVAADLSNITGSELDKLFRNITISDKYTADFNFGSFIWNTISNIGTAAPLAIAGTAIGITIADGGWGVLIMPILLATIVGFISILFFYVLLAVRRAAIYILIAISPIAVVCYILPNTQRLFSRWLKMFTSMLLVFPICGALMGGGNFASRLLLITASDSTGFVYILVCSLLSVVPFFFIPTILKNSMSALGSIGAKLANMGSRLSNMATGAVRRSRWAQDHQQEIARNIDIGRGKRLQARNQKVLDKLNKRRTNPNQKGDLSGLSAKEQEQYLRAQRREARAISTQNRRHSEDIEAENIAEYFNEEMLQNQDATARRKYYEGVVNNIADGAISSGTYRRSDGSSVAFDPNDPDSIQQALLDSAQDVKDHPEDAMAMARMEGMMTVAKRLSGKGRQKILDTLHSNDNTPDGLAAARSIAKKLLLDDRFMAALHANDAGSEEYIQDLATGKTIKTRSEYAKKTIESMKLDTVGDLDDSFQDNFKALYDEIDTLRKTPNISATERQKLTDLEKLYQKGVNTMVQAANDPRYAGKIKSKDAEGFINKHAKQSYNMEREDWINGSDANGIANVTKLTVTDASGNTINATGVNNGYLMNGNQLMRDAGGNLVKAEDAYGNQIKAYHDVTLGQGNPADLKIPHKRDIPYTLDTATGNYRAENDVYVHDRQQWKNGTTNGNSNVMQLTGYIDNGGGNMVQVTADGEDKDGDLYKIITNSTGQQVQQKLRSSAHVSASTLSANDAYDRQVAYANQRTSWIGGTQPDGSANVTQLTGYVNDGTGKMIQVHADGVDANGDLYQTITSSVTGQPMRRKMFATANANASAPALKAVDAYDRQIHAATDRFRDLRQDEQRKLNQLLDINASIDIQHEDRQQNQQP